MVHKLKTPTFTKATAGKQKSKIKTASDAVKNTIQNSKFYFLIALFIFLLVLVSLNIYSSQAISPLYTQLVNEKYQAVVDYVKKIRSTPEFSFFLETNKKIYGSGIENDVFIEESQKKEQIRTLEEALIKNPKARDVLLRLSNLYKELGNDSKAEEYLKRAREVDPNLN